MKHITKYFTVPWPRDKANDHQRQEHSRQLAENRIRLSAVESCIADRLGDADDVRPTDRVTLVFASQADASPCAECRSLGHIHRSDCSLQPK